MVAAGEYDKLIDAYGLGQNFCVSMLRGVTPDEALRRLGAREPVDRKSRAGLDKDAVAATEAGEWTLMLEQNSSLGTTDPAIRLLSAGGEMVSFHCGENSEQFVFAVDGEALVRMSLDEPHDTTGADPYLLYGAIQELGFDSTDGHDRGRALVLMERITGVRISPEMLETATFRVARI